jgi:hypothetical protein
MVPRSLVGMGKVLVSNISILWKLAAGTLVPGTRTTKACAKSDFSFCPCKALI